MLGAMSSFIGRRLRSWDKGSKQSVKTFPDSLASLASSCYNLNINSEVH